MATQQNHVIRFYQILQKRKTATRLRLKPRYVYKAVSFYGATRFLFLCIVL